MPRSRVGYERELANLLFQSGLPVCRAGASGGARRGWASVDIFAWCPKTGRLYAIEVKSTKKRSGLPESALRMLSAGELESLRALAEMGAVPVLAVRLVGKRRGPKWLAWVLELEEGGARVAEPVSVPDGLC